MENFELLQNCSLFKGISKAGISEIIKSCGTKRKYQKNEFLMQEGYSAHDIGILLSGTLTAQKHTASGRAFTITSLSAGDVFGDVLAGGNAKSPVTITALSDCNVLLLSFAVILQKSSAKAPDNLLLLQNLVATISDKYFALDKRVSLLLEKSLRVKVLAYLTSFANNTKANSFIISGTRQQMADYLGCERSALCRELSRLEAEGKISYTKNAFTIFGYT